MADYISREAAIKTLRKAEALTFEAFNRILTENNTMREQLAAIGKKPGDKMDDVIKLPAFANGESRKWIDALPPPWWELLKEVQDGN